MPSSFTKNFTTFSGADIVCTFDGIVVGELQALSVTVSREKTFVYTMGSPDPRSITRGKRAIGGSLVFIVFDKEALLSALSKNSEQKLTTRSNPDFVGSGGNLPQAGERSGANLNDGEPRTITGDEFNFADQLLPFDIVVTYANEYGAKAKMILYGVEILSDGMGVSVDDLVVERQYSYIALSMKNLRRIDAQGTEAATNNDLYSNR